MKLGLHLNDFDWAGGADRLGPTLSEIARAGDEAGFDRIGVADHFWRSHYMFAFDVGEDGQDSGKIGALLGQLRWLVGMGIQTVIGFVPHVDRIKPLETIGREVIPAVSGL